MYLQNNSGRRLCAAITAALLAAIQISVAQTPAKKQQKTQDIPEVVITATMSETESWRTASSVTVIDRKKIEEQQFHFAIDALRNVESAACSIADGASSPTFTGGNAIRIHGLNPPEKSITLVRQPWTVPAVYQDHTGLKVIPWEAGHELAWRIAP